MTQLKFLIKLEADIPRSLLHKLGESMGKHVIKKIAVIIVIGFQITACSQVNQAIVSSPDTQSIEEAWRLKNEFFYSKAVEQYRIAINDDPSLTDAYIETAQIYTIKRDYESAIEILTSGEEFAQNRARIFEEKGIVYLAQDDLGAAEEAFTVAYEQDGDNITNAFYLVETMVRKSDFSGAVEILKALETDDQYYKSKQLLYLGLFSFDEINTAIDYIDKGLESPHPDWKEGLESLKVTFADIKERNGDQVYTNTLIAYELMKFGFHETAIPILDQTVKLNDEHWAAFMYLGISSLEVEDYDTARDSLSLAVGINPTNADLYHLYGYALTKLRFQNDAIEAFEKAIQLSDGENEVILHDYARALEEFGLLNQSIVEYKELIALNTSRQHEYRIELGYLYLNEQRNFIEAEKIARILIEQWEGFENASDSIKAQTYDIVGWALEQQENRDEARQYLEQAVTLDASLASAHYHLGQLFVRIEQFTRARESFDRAIDVDLEGEITVGAKAELENI